MDIQYNIKIYDIVKKYGVSQATVQRAVVRGDLRAIKVGKQWRTCEEWINDWIVGNKKVEE